MCGVVQDVSEALATIGRGRVRVQALAVLKDTACLHTLTLDLSKNAVGASGAEALVALRKAPSLHTLKLNLWDNSVGEAVPRHLQH